VHEVTYWFVNVAEVESWGRSTVSEWGRPAILTYGKVLELLMALEEAVCQSVPLGTLSS